MTATRPSSSEIHGYRSCGFGYSFVWQIWDNRGSTQGEINADYDEVMGCKLQNGCLNVKWKSTWLLQLVTGSNAEKRLQSAPPVSFPEFLLALSRGIWWTVLPLHTPGGKRTLQLQRVLPTNTAHQPGLEIGYLDLESGVISFLKNIHDKQWIQI